MRYISSVNRCGTALLGGRACSPLVFCARLHRFGVRTQGMAIMRTLREGICQCIKYVERHLRVKCNYTDSRKFQWESYFIYYITFLYIYIYITKKKKHSVFVSRLKDSTLFSLHSFIHASFCLCNMQSTRCYLWHTVHSLVYIPHYYSVFISRKSMFFSKHLKYNFPDIMPLLSYKIFRIRVFMTEPKSTTPLYAVIPRTKRQSSCHNPVLFAMCKDYIPRL